MGLEESQLLRLGFNQCYKFAQVIIRTSVPKPVVYISFSLLGQSGETALIPS